MLTPTIDLLPERDSRIMLFYHSHEKEQASPEMKVEHTTAQESYSITSGSSSKQLAIIKNFYKFEKLLEMSTERHLLITVLVLIIRRWQQLIQSFSKKLLIFT
jgi:hypothetical protein